MDILHCHKCKVELCNSNWFSYLRGHERICKTCTRTRLRGYYLAKVEYNRAKQSKYILELKKRVFEHYGNMCVCCGIDYFFYLQLDHKNNDGAEHRKALGNTGKVAKSWWLWVIRNEFPNTLQLLCANCHLAKTRGQPCQH